MNMLIDQKDEKPFMVYDVSLVEFKKYISNVNHTFTVSLFDEVGSRTYHQKGQKNSPKPPIW